MLEIRQSLKKRLMVKLDDDNIEDFIRKNKKKFEVYRPPENHLDRFLLRLNYELRQIISIIPYLVRVAVATVIIFLASIVVWNNFIRKDRKDISLRDKISLVISKVSTDL
jgi:hypothetical protein